MSVENVPTSREPAICSACSLPARTAPSRVGVTPPDHCQALDYSCSRQQQLCYCGVFDAITEPDAVFENENWLVGQVGRVRFVIEEQRKGRHAGTKNMPLNEGIRSTSAIAIPTEILVDKEYVDKNKED